MSKRLKITCPRADADEIEAKLLELDENANIEVTDPPKLSGAVEIMSIAASVTTIAASGFVIWAEAEKRWGQRVTIEAKDEEESDSTKQSQED